MSQITTMKVMLIVLLVLSIFDQYLIVEAYEASVLPNPNRKPGGCYEKEFGHLKGDTVTQHYCAMVDCNSNGEILIMGCISLVMETGCTADVPQDNKKPFPDCCGIKCRAIPHPTPKPVLRTTPKPPPKTTRIPLQ